MNSIIALSTAVFLAIASFATHAQTIVMKGIVIDKGGNPLPGCNVLIKGTTNGTATDMCGEFSLPVEQERFTVFFSDMSYEDLRVFEIPLRKKEITGDKIIFQIGNSRKRNKSCKQTIDRKLRTIRIR